MESADIPGVRFIGLEPLAVLRKFQRQGIGAKLVELGCGKCLKENTDVIAVLDSPKYYQRFGFENAAQYHINSNFNNIPDSVFMLNVLSSYRSLGQTGEVRYDSAFPTFEK